MSESGVSTVPDFFLRNLWPGLVLCGVFYVSDYVLTITCARLYRNGINEKIVFEGSFELNPFFQRDIDSLRRVSPRFLWALLLSEGWLAFCWLLSGQSQPAFYELVLGIVILVEVMVHMRHLHNLYLFRAINGTGGVRGRIEYSRALLLRLSSAECFIFSGAFLLLFAFTASWFILGGVIGCMSLAVNNLKLARKCRTSPAVAVQASQ